MTGNTFFWQIWTKVQNFLKLSLIPRLIRIYRIQWLFSFSSCLDRKYTFWVTLVQKFKIVNLSWNLVSRLFRIWSCFFSIARNCSFFMKSKHSSKFGFVLQWCLVPILPLFKVRTNKWAKMSFSLNEQKIQGYLFKTKQNFVIGKTLVWSGYVCTTATATFLNRRVIYELGSHFSQIYFI